jgi:mevalonate kinase
MRPAPFPPIRLSIESTIPVASGLGSSAAVSVAIARAMNDHFGGSLTTFELSALAYTGETILHGTPSGIDNTVVAFDQPVFFVRGHPPEALRLRAAFHLVIGDTGIPAPTAQAVGHVRQRWQADSAPLETLFDSIGEMATQGRQALIDGDSHRLGACMNEDHRLLVDLGVSSPELDRLVESARAAGAFGAKMTGGGMGGNMVALASPSGVEAVSRALRMASAAGVIHTEVAP